MFTRWTKEHLKQLTDSEKYMLRESGLPQYQWIEEGIIPSKIDEDAYERLFAIRENLPEFLVSPTNNLVICGRHLGNGKTSWAVKLLLTFIENYSPILDKMAADSVDAGEYDMCLFCQTIAFLVEMKHFGNNSEVIRMYERLKRTQLAVLDDIAITNVSQYDYNNLYAIIEARQFSGLPTIYTTNATNEDELTEIIGPRLADRIWKTSEIVELRGEGHRGV